MRSYNWSVKGIRRMTTGTGRMRHLKTMARRFKNGFREGRMLWGDWVLMDMCVGTEAKPRVAAKQD